MHCLATRCRRRRQRSIHRRRSIHLRRSSGSGSSSSSLAIGLGVGLGLFAVIVGGSAATYCWWKKTHAGAVSHDVPVKGVVSV